MEISKSEQYKPEAANMLVNSSSTENRSEIDQLTQIIRNVDWSITDEHITWIPGPNKVRKQVNELIDELLRKKIIERIPGPNEKQMDELLDELLGEKIIEGSIAMQ